MHGGGNENDGVCFFQCCRFMRVEWGQGVKLCKLDEKPSLENSEIVVDDLMRTFG